MENEIYGCHFYGPEGKIVKWEVDKTDSTLCTVVGFCISGVKPSGFSAIVLVIMFFDSGHFQDANFPTAPICVLLARIHVCHNPITDCS
jgi:hypothetical protein